MTYSFQSPHSKIASNSIAAFFKVSQAFAILGILGHVATFVLLFIFTLLPKLSGQRLALFASITASAISGE